MQSDRFDSAEICSSMNDKKTEHVKNGIRPIQAIMQRLRHLNQKLVQITDQKIPGDSELSTINSIFTDAKRLLTDNNRPQIFVQNQTHDVLKQTLLLRKKSLALRRLQMRQDLVDLASEKLELANVKVSLKEVEVDLLEKELRLLQSDMTTM